MAEEGIVQVLQPDPASFEPHDSLGAARLTLGVKHASSLILIGAESRHFHCAGRARRRG